MQISTKPKFTFANSKMFLEGYESPRFKQKILWENNYSAKNFNFESRIL